MYYKVLFMSLSNQVSPPSGERPEQALADIRQMMERSSRFISLSGLSGIAAGLCALGGIYIVTQKTGCWKIGECLFPRLGVQGSRLERELYIIAGATFIAAFSLAYLFTWLRCRKKRIPMWGPVSRRLLWNVAIPLLSGAVFLYAMTGLKQYELVAPGCLVFYGLALVNASKYTFTEIRFLGYAEILLGLINCFCIGYGLHFLALGFGVLHILYGALMWWRYERTSR